MAEKTVDLCVIGGGVNGAAIARDAAGRGLSVLLAEKDDYACGTSSASSNLIHGGLRYLETFEFGLVRQSLREREVLLKAAPYLAEPLRFLVPLVDGVSRPAWMVHLGLKLYDFLAGSKSLGRSGRLTQGEIQALPRLRKDRLTAVLHYHDCRTDDARLVMALLLDARARGADIGNRREVTAIRALENGFQVAFTENGDRRTVDARFVVNAAGPWVARVNALCDAPPPERPMRLVRGSHIVLPMPEPPQLDAYTMQNSDGRVVFALPWLKERFLVIGTTDVPHEGDPSEAQCTAAERDYLLEAYNSYFDHPGGPAIKTSVNWSWSGVRPLLDDGSGAPSRVTRSSATTNRAQGNGGIAAVYGGKLTTHRELAEEMMDDLARMGLAAGSRWTRDAILPGGHLSLPELDLHAARGPEAVAPNVRRRWAQCYGDRVMLLYDIIAHHPESAREIAPGVPEAELIFAHEQEDAVEAEDFLVRRTKLIVSLPQAPRAAIDRWFARGDGR